MAFSLFLRKQHVPQSYDPEEEKPVIQCSICTGEQTAGFLKKPGGHFEGVMLIRNERDLEKFRKAYGIIGEIEKIY